ncbi:MAG TPA: hypothetical protein VFY26_07380 [Anaerolineales bacterium]|nr:hypothetical protein [Anaerolineales bacterium]
MKRDSRLMLVCAFMLFFLSSACGALGGSTPTPVEEVHSDEFAQSSQAGSAHDAQSTGMAIIPITGENAASIQCQFCVNDETHVVLALPEYAYFDVVSSTPVRCITANIVNGRRILLCRGAQSTSFSLNICSDSTNCLQFPVVLEPCLLLPGGAPLGASTPSSPVFLTPVSPSGNQNSNPPPPGSGPVIPTLHPPVVPTDLPLPTDELLPPPPVPTQGGGGGGEQGGDIVICHIPPGNPENQKTMTVSLSAWQNEHSRHGDSRGEC